VARRTPEIPPRAGPGGLSELPRRARGDGPAGGSGVGLSPGGMFPRGKTAMPIEKPLMLPQSH